MRISIVIPAYNEAKVIADSLARIRAGCGPFHRRGWEVEIVVCDNNSTDTTAALARECGARVVFEPVNQISRARNAGAREAAGEWLVFIDADSHPPEGLLEDVAGCIESGNVLGGGSVVHMEGVSLLPRLFCGAWNLVSRLRRWAAGSFIFCRAEAFREVGGFSGELFAGEEIELSTKLKALARGRGLRFVILHRHPLVTSGRKMQLYTAREHLRFCWQTLIRLGGTLRDRSACPIWYDGRR